jgi:hypothetical protein
MARSELSNTFAFSWSRHQMFYQCPRKLYWYYYGSWEGWRADAPAQARLAYRLKQIKSLEMLVGETFHEELATILRRRPDPPAAVPVAHLIADMERRLLKRIRESRNADWDRYGNPRHYTILFEDYYQAGVTQAMEDAALAVLRRCVAGLASDPFGRRAFAVEKEKLVYVDPPRGGDGAERGVRHGDILLYASPDLVVRGKERGLHIVDWKTGRPYAPNDAQLAVYGLFVSRRFGVALEDLTAHVVYLAAGTRRTINVAEGVAEATRAIDTFVEDVRSRLTDPDKNLAGDPSRFPMTEQRWRCRRCAFRELCGRADEPAEAPGADDP